MLSTARLAHPDRTIAPGWVSVSGATIVGVGRPPPPPGTRVDLGDLLVSAGFVDLHVHGAAGCQVNGQDPATVEASTNEVAAFHAAHGTTALVATTVTDSLEILEASLAGIARATRAGPGLGARVLGSHLEGPWLSPVRRGAHDRDQLLLPVPEVIDRLLAAAAGTLRIVTIAPELAGAHEAVRRLVAAGVVVAVGHTDADLATARAGFAAGASHLTHCFNAMPPLVHRAPGPIGAALAEPGVSIEVIPDGIHVHPLMLGLLSRLVGDRLVAVTDASAACGMAEGRHRLGRSEVVLSDGAVTLASDRSTLAGSALTMERAVAGLVAAGVDLALALYAATSAPAVALRTTRGAGLVAGAGADLVVLGADLGVRATVVGGVPVHDPAGLFAGLLPPPPDDDPARRRAQ